jgi:2-oxoglutarate dehydrogenase E1 component
MIDFGVNQGLVEELYLRYCSNPASVPREWRSYFERLPADELPELTSAGTVAAPANGDTHVALPKPAAVPSNGPTNGPANGPTNGPTFLPGNGGLRPSVMMPPTTEMVTFPAASVTFGTERQSFPPSSEVVLATELQGRVSALVNAYRVRGHLFAKLDPLGLYDLPPDELRLDRYGLADVAPDTLFSAGDLASDKHFLTLKEIVEQLRETYCRTIGVEFSFIESSVERNWLQEQMERTNNRLQLSTEDQVRILTKLTDAEIFEEFLHKNYVGAKRFSLEGAESFIPLMDLVIERSGSLGVSEIVIGMAHRGRLNVLANTLGKRLHEIFAVFEDHRPEEMLGRGDVKYHLGYSVDRTTRDGKKVHLTLCFNPSHLEFVGAVVEGRVRAKQARIGDNRSAVLPLAIHGDAAFVGQGIVAETLNLSGLDGYQTGGTLHVVINNQVGFTTLPNDSRTTRYCTDLTRMLRCPVFHVNGEDPEAVAQVVKLATDFRQKFRRDVVIDLYCYRKYGHNEGDEPRFTQPAMYNLIDKKRTVRQVYVDALVETGRIDAEQAQAIMVRRQVELEAALRETREKGPADDTTSSMQGLWHPYRGGHDEDVPDVKTAVERGRLESLLKLVNRVPEGCTAHPKIAKLYEQRIEAGLEDKGFDWGAAETLAYATLVTEGIPVRLTGQDSRRGTFSHRHSVLYDQKTGASYCPLQLLAPNQARFEVWDSPLSEAGCLGFEYGFSLDSPDALVIWEAQFGDFANGAQVIIDQFIVSSEDKWNRLSGLVLFLPHGFEGQGPEHSSARLERFLNMAVEDNIQVCNLTTASQIFHCLRRQVLRPFRKPLVIMTPKSLLRATQARGTLDELANGSFQRIIPDLETDPKKVKRVLLCSGKVYYDLAHARQKRGEGDTAIIRLEQLYPIRKAELQEVLAPYGEKTDLVWVQEEPWNMGAWLYILARVPDLLDHKYQLRSISRPPSASPATGSKAAHDLEQHRIVDEAFAPRS